LRLARDGCVLLGGVGDDVLADDSLVGGDDVGEDLGVELLLSAEDFPGDPAFVLVFCAAAAAALSLLSFAKNCLAAGGGLLLLLEVALLPSAAASNMALLEADGCCTMEHVRCLLPDIPSEEDCDNSETLLCRSIGPRFNELTEPTLLVLAGGIRAKRRLGIMFLGAGGLAVAGARDEGTIPGRCTGWWPCTSGITMGRLTPSFSITAHALLHC